MAQSEDTELRDLVMEALEKNGSLAKIRALLRANIFLAFEDDYESIRQNATLDTVLKVPEGILALSIVNEFLEFCNLKNTLFVYKSETRQEREFKYEGQKKLCEKLNIKQEDVREPVLVSIVKYIVKSRQKHFNERNNKPGIAKHDNLNYKDDQNCTYIVHDDSSSTTSQSQSDNSSDEKTKLHLRLQLDNSDTDTSSDSARDKSTNSEYIPNAHILHVNDSQDISKQNTASVMLENEKNLTLQSKNDKTSPYFLNELKNLHNSSSDSTSYVELKPFNAADEKLLNTTGIPVTSDNNYGNFTTLQSPSKENNKSEHFKKGTELNSSVQNNLDNSSSISHKIENENNKDRSKENKPQELSSTKSESETAEYSYDFSLSGGSKHNDVNSENPSPKSIQEDLNDGNINKNIADSPHNSHSSRSSVSISDVADLISENSLSIGKINKDISLNKSKMSNQQLNISPRNIKSPSNDSGDFSESPVPSLSNLSLDIHSD
ncbi:unnamed protein product [Chilo suppressalis]|uniref:FGFR1 oncogene partner (FOP) N-terminal dimerisation domain-containing protein n=1 Tax=Chilo suppressalis TaxID=168631 RepID=A0ABN8BGE8_CHISP|nr:unnamed protein product [Chilo suppressalis]